MGGGAGETISLIGRLIKLAAGQNTQKSESAE
jgi:hypothetical protein